MASATDMYYRYCDSLCRLLVPLDQLIGDTAEPVQPPRALPPADLVLLPHKLHLAADPSARPQRQRALLGGRPRARVRARPERTGCGRAGGCRAGLPLRTRVGWGVRYALLGPSKQHFGAGAGRCGGGRMGSAKTACDLNCKRASESVLGSLCGRHASRRPCCRPQQAHAWHHSTPPHTVASLPAVVAVAAAVGSILRLATGPPSPSSPPRSDGR